MTDEELIEAVAAEVICHLWATIAVGNNDDCGVFPEMPAYVQETYRKAARAVIPLVQDAKDARIAELEQLVIQYRDDLKYPPADDSRERRLEAVNHALRSTQ